MSSKVISRLRWRDVDVRGAWQCALLPIVEYPLQGERAEVVRRFCKVLGLLLTDKYQMEQQVLLQTWKLKPDTGLTELHARRREWRTELGLGIWPNRQPPQSWSEERMVDAAADVFAGAEPELPAHPLLRIRARRDDSLAAAELMHGYGVAIEIFSRLPVDQLDADYRELLLPRITLRRFQHQQFYSPMLDRTGFLQVWPDKDGHDVLAGAEVYLRDSAEDGGLLLLSRMPLQDLLEEVAALLQQ